MYLDGLSDAVTDPAALLKLHWETVYKPGDTPVIKPEMPMVGGFGPGTAIARAKGYTGPILADGAVEIVAGEGQDSTRVHAAPHPALIAWLRDNDFTVKVASPGTGGSSGYGYTSFWKNGQMVGVNSVAWSNKPGVVGYLVMGMLAAAGGAALMTAAGAAGAGAAAAGGAGAAGTAGAASAIAPIASTAVAAAAPAAAVAVPTVAAAGSTAGWLATVAKAAPSVIGLVKAQQDAKAKAEIVEAQKAQQQLPIAPPAGMIQQMIPSPSAGFAPSQYGQLTPFQSAGTTPPWLIPAAIGGGMLILTLMMMMNRRR